MIFSRFLQNLPRFQRITRSKTARYPVRPLMVKQQALSTQFSVPFFTHFQLRHWYSLIKKSAQRLRNYLAQHANFHAPSTLSLAEAAQILAGIRQQPQTPDTRMLQRKAFARMYNFLRQQPCSLQTGPLQPLLMLMASSFARLPDMQQRTQALMLIEKALIYTPQLALAETLTMQLWGLSGGLIPRAFDAIDGFLQQGCVEPRLQIDILLELTDLMQVPSCRQRARALVRDGLKRLAATPSLRKRIEARMALSGTDATDREWYGFGS